MAKEASPRVIVQKTKEERLRYMDKHNIDFIKMLGLEEAGKVEHEVILELYNKIEGTSKEVTLKSDYVSLILSSEIIFRGKMEDKIETPNYTLKLKEVKLIDKD